LATLNKNWEAKKVTIPAVVSANTVTASKIYFYDVPCKQSVIRIGYPALAAIDPDFYPAQILNYRLGGGFCIPIDATIARRKRLYLWH
jgi:zinc protease